MADEPHDKLFKQTFSKPENAIVELRAVLPEALLRKVDLSTLRPAPELTVGKDLSVRHCDLLFSATIGGAPGYIYLLLEHQSTVDRLMAFRILEYVVRVISRHVERAPKKKVLPLPAVIPVVLHHSDSGWTAATEVSELFEETLTQDASLAAYLPRLSFLLDDISKLSDDQLKARAEPDEVVPLVLWALRDARHAERIMATFRAWTPVLRQMSRTKAGQDALLAVVSYLMMAPGELSREQIETVVSEAAPEAKETYMTLAEQLEQQGLAKGRQEGQREIVSKLLSLKFGTLTGDVSVKLDAATDADLSLWAERVLTAENLDEVFG